ATLGGLPAPVLRPLVARAGDVLSFARPGQGARAYLAVHGGYDLPMVMGSQSTYLRSAFGGYHGRALAKGDQVGLRRPLADDAARLDALAQQLWQLRFYLAATLSSPPRDVLRILPGPHWEAFDAASRQALLDQAFRIGAQSDRMGYRLEGPRLRLSERREMLSEATCFGTVQVPADGAPIVLMADRQTTGGYPKLAQVATVDLPSLAQAMPGQALRFALIELEQAQRLDAAREAAFAQLTGQLDALRGLLRNFQEPTP
ncbi:biotin-dependent carboxyltransferase family protein, partial [Bordetella bronchiseptica]